MATGCCDKPNKTAVGLNVVKGLVQKHCDAGMSSGPSSLTNASSRSLKRLGSFL